ncbi:MAG: hypothetical protein ACN6NZ_08055 [Burkholderiales bacterium]
MPMIDHAENADTEYHFESSDEYCSPDLVEQVAQALKQSMSLTAADLAQLATIVNLERLRHDFAHSGQSLAEHGREIQRLRNELIEHHRREPFDNGKLEKAFYKALNKAYGYVG